MSLTLFRAMNELQVNKDDFFLLVWGLDNKQNNTWLLGDMEFLLSCSAQYFTHLLCSLVRYQVEQGKNFHISMCPRIIHNIHWIQLKPIEVFSGTLI